MQPSLMDAVFGGHFNANTGQGNDSAIQWQKKSRGKFATVVGGGSLAAELMAIGAEVIGRDKSEPFNDDDGDAHGSGESFARHLDALYPPGVWLYAGNELGTSTPDRTQDWIIKFVEEAARLSRRVVAYNFSVFNPTDAYLRTQQRALDAILYNDGRVGLHQGFNTQYRGAAALGNTLGVALPYLEKLHIRSIITEICGAAEARKGRSILYGGDLEAEIADMRVAAKCLADFGAYGTIFTYYPWSEGEGFEFYNDEPYKDAIVVINQQYPVKGLPVMPDTTIRDMSEYITADELNAHGLGGVHGSSGWEVVRSHRMGGGKVHFEKGSRQIESLYYDATMIYRGWDTSSITLDELYGQFTGDAAHHTIWAAWCPRYMKEGDVFTRSPFIQHFHSDGSTAGKPGGVDISQIKFAKHYDTWTADITGIVLNDVVELHWIKNGVVLEKSFYARGKALVEFDPVGIAGGYHSQIALLDTAPLWNPTLPSWCLEPVPTQPAPTPLPLVVVPSATGTGVPMIVRADRGLNMRADAGTAKTILRTLADGAEVNAYPNSSDPSAHIANGYLWWFIRTHESDPGWVANQYLVPAPVAQTWTANLELPYISQLGPDADSSNNDCLVATILMMMFGWSHAHGLLVPSLPTVNDLTSKTSLALPDPPSGLGFPEGVRLLGRLGYPAEYIHPMTIDKIVSYIDSGKSVAVLIDYSIYFPGSTKISHILPVFGYNDQSFLTHDPYLKGQNVPVLKTTLEAAMKKSPGNSVPFQGMILNV